jgi:3-oxoacyl-[acyl-carrier protein] reductase
VGKTMTTDRLEGRVALITGASSGLGPVMAKLFVQHGAHVMLAARREDLVQAAAADCGSGAAAMKADVTKEEDVVAMVQRTVEAFGQIDVLCNNAATPGQDLFVW